MLASRQMHGCAFCALLGLRFQSLVRASVRPVLSCTLRCSLQNQSIALCNAGMVQRQLGRLVEARECCRSALEISLQSGDSTMEMLASGLLGITAACIRSSLSSPAELVSHCAVCVCRVFPPVSFSVAYVLNVALACTDRFAD